MPSDICSTFKPYPAYGFNKCIYPILSLDYTWYSYSDNSVSAVSSSALCPHQPVNSHVLEAVTSPPLLWHSGISSYSRNSYFQRFFAKRGYVVHLYHRSYNLIRQSDRILPISDFNPYTAGLWHSRIVPAYLPDLPQFTLCFLLYMPPSLPRQAVSLHLSVSSRNVSVFAHNVKARHLLPAHVTFHPAMREGQQISRGCNVRFMLRPAKLLAPLRRPPLLSRGSGYFYFRAFPQSVTLMRVAYNYLGEQTIPRTGLSPAGNAVLWAAHVDEFVE